MSSGASFTRKKGTPLVPRVRAKMKRIFNQAALFFETEEKKLLSTPGTGRTYISRRARSASGRAKARRGLRKIGGKVGQKGLGARVRELKGSPMLHVASAPGQPPAVDTGELRAAVGAEVREKNGRPELVGGVRTSAANSSKLHRIAMTLERPESSPIRPRPSWSIALRETIRFVRDRMAEEGRK